MPGCAGEKRGAARGENGVSLRRGLHGLRDENLTARAQVLLWSVRCGQTGCPRWTRSTLCGARGWVVRSGRPSWWWLFIRSPLVQGDYAQKGFFSVTNSSQKRSQESLPESASPRRGTARGCCTAGHRDRAWEGHVSSAA